MPRCVLVVDDDPQIRSALVVYLSTFGYHVTTAADGRAALAALAEAAETPAVILLDLEMPVMSGREFLVVLRAGPWAGLPVVILTGSTNLDGLNGETVLRKPADADAILAALARAVGPREAAS